MLPRRRRGRRHAELVVRPGHTTRADGVDTSTCPGVLGLVLA